MGGIFPMTTICRIKVLQNPMSLNRFTKGESKNVNLSSNYYKQCLHMTVNEV